MNKKLTVSLLLILLLAPVTNTRAACVGCAAGLSTGAAVGIGFGVAGALALIGLGIHHHNKKKREGSAKPQQVTTKQSARRAKKYNAKKMATQPIAIQSEAIPVAQGA